MTLQIKYKKEFWGEMHKCHEKGNILYIFLFWQARQEYVTDADLQVYNL